MFFSDRFILCYSLTPYQLKDSEELRNSYLTNLKGEMALKEEIEKLKKEILDAEKRIAEKEKELGKNGFLEWQVDRHLESFCKGKKCFVCGKEANPKYSFPNGLQILCLCFECYPYPEETMEEWLERLRQKGYDTWIEFIGDTEEKFLLRFSKKGEKPSCLQ